MKGEGNKKILKIKGIRILEIDTHLFAYRKMIIGGKRAWDINLTVTLTFIVEYL